MLSDSKVLLLALAYFNTVVISIAGKLIIDCHICLNYEVFEAWLYLRYIYFLVAQETSLD